MRKRISKKKLYDLFSATLLRAVQMLPMDVKKAIGKTLESETHPIARLHLETFLKNAELGEERRTFVCPDTGWVIFYVKIGDGVELEGGLSSLQAVAKKVVASLSARGKLRPTLADPVTRKNMDSNVGDKFPKVEVLPSSSIRTIEVTAIPKGGGSEISGTFFRMLLPADGMNGVIRFVIDSFLASSYAGKTCPPNIIGVGIGGTGDVCMEMAKKAAVLRVVGDRHPDPQIAKLELDLLSALNELMIGPMGTGGRRGVLDVHIEKGLVHTGALPVAFTAQCCLSRRATGRLNARGEVVFVDNPKWRD